MLNHYDLGLYVAWFEIPRDFIGLPELYGLKCENLITSVIFFCTCALIIWTVPLHFLILLELNPIFGSFHR
jgi:hypothetical protein